MTEERPERLSLRSSSALVGDATCAIRGAKRNDSGTSYTKRNYILDGYFESATHPEVANVDTVEHVHGGSENRDWVYRYENINAQTLRDFFPVRPSFYP